MNANTYITQATAVLSATSDDDRLSNAFVLFDSDASLNMQEFSAVILGLSQRHLTRKLPTIFKDCDINNSGVLDYNEFLLTINDVLMVEDINDVIKQFFNIYDQTKDGRITFPEFQRVFKRLEPDVGSSEYASGDANFVAVDTNNDGVVTYQEYLIAIQNVEP